MTIDKPRKEASEETNSANNLTLNFQPSELCENKHVKPLSFWNFVRGTLEN